MNDGIVLMTASGGGHTGYSLAIADAMARLYGRKVDIYFVVQEGDSWSSVRVGRYGKLVYTARGRRPGESLARALLGFGRGFIESLARIPKSRVAVCTGHNHSIPPCIASIMKGSNVILVEDAFRISGGSRSIRMLSRLPSLVALQWEEQRSLYDRGVVVGPIYEDPIYEPWDGGYILVTTGTHGYKRLFDSLLHTSLDNVVIQTGRINPEPYRAKRPRWRVFKFSPDIDRWIAGASIVMTHIGMTALNSALAYGKPTIIVYNPEWRLAGPPQDALTVARKINALFLPKPAPGLIEALVDKAVKLKPRRFHNGAHVLARIIMNMVS